MGADNAVTAGAVLKASDSDVVSVSCCKATNSDKFATETQSVGQSRALTAGMDLLEETGKLPSLTADIGISKDCMPPNTVAVKGDLQPPPMMSLPPSSTGESHATSSSLTSTNVHKTHLSNNRNAMHNKGSMSMESQYMQQQSQVFVFSTQLANHAADAIMSGQYPSIIAFHCSQPATKSILEKHPLNEQQFKQSPGSWLNNFAQLKQGAKGMKGSINSGMSPVLNTQYPPPFRGNLNRAPCVRPCSHGQGGCAGPPMASGNSTNWTPMPDMCPDIGWQSQQNFVNSSPNMPANMRHPNSIAANRGANPGNNPVMSPTVGQNSYSNNQMCFPSHNCIMQMPSSMPTGTKVPDENLTPQQRQHREEQLARLRELEMMINGSELMNNPQGNMRLPAPNQQMPSPCGQSMMDSCAPNSCMLPESDHSNDHSGSNINNPSSVMVSSCGMPNCPPNHSNMPNCAQMEWHKLQHQYFEDRRRKCPPQLSGSSHPSPMSQTSSLNSPNPNVAPSPGKRMAGPPPPYRQGPRPLSSPHPSSPAATSSLSLPSPQMQSPAESSRPFSTGTSCRLPPYTSPGPPTPLAENVPMNSPKPGANTSLSSTTSGGTANTPVSRTPTTGCNTTPSSLTSSNTSPTMKKVTNLQANTLASDNSKSDSTVNSTGLMSDSKSSLHSLNCNSPEMCNLKSEPQLYPVPSPQQIQYLSTFDGQELTIQKQPNTSLVRETDLISPPELNFNNEFNSPQFPPQSMENGRRFMSPVENNVNHRFPGMNMNPNLCGPHYDMPPNQRFMTPDSAVQRFNNPSFEPNRMPNSMDVGNQQMRPNMGCPPFNGPRMDSSRFPSQENYVNNRMRGPNPMDVGMQRFSSHMNDNMPQPQYNAQMMHPMISDHQFNGPPHAVSNCLNQNSGSEGISSTHLQNLQKMTPPFDIGPTSKIDNMIGNNGQMLPTHPNGPPMHSAPQSAQQMSQFDPIASMAAMSETPPVNPNMMPGSMNMSSMQVANSGTQAGGMVNFHTSMSSSMAHQNMGSNNNPNNTGMHYGGMSSQMSHNMVGGPQTVNNTYVNATMSIQQLNIQNVTSPNFNSNVPMQSCMNNPQGINPMSGPPLTGNMQMMSHNSVSPKMGMNASPVLNPRISSNNPQHPYQPHQPLQRGINPMSYSGNANMGQRGSGPYNSPNIQVKASAPNTIQYLPSRPVNSGQQPASRPPNLDFLHRFTTPLTNLDNKVPTHNLQYYPSNMSSPQPTPPPNSNVPMSVGPGRPPMMRNSGNGMMVPGGPAPCPGGGPGSGHPMMNEMFNRMPNPNAGPPPHNQIVSNSYKSGGRGPGTLSPLGMPPDASQPLPPSVGHSYNYKQTQFYGNPAADPNYAVQFHNFQQQLYATNTRGNSSTNNGTGGNQVAPNSNLPPSNFFSAQK